MEIRSSFGAGTSGVKIYSCITAPNFSTFSNNRKLLLFFVYSSLTSIKFMHTSHLNNYYSRENKPCQFISVRKKHLSPIAKSIEKMHTVSDSYGIRYIQLPLCLKNLWDQSCNTPIVLRSEILHQHCLVYKTSRNESIFCAAIYVND